MRSFQNGRLVILLLSGIGVGTGSRPAAAQQAVPAVSESVRLSLSQTIQLALQGSQSRAAEERVMAAGFDRQAVSARRLPTAGLDLSAIGTSDPVGAFGTRLRQERFTQSDFELSALNSPSPIGDLAGSAGVRWTLFDRSIGSEIAVSSALLDGAVATRARVQELTVFRARLLYIGVNHASAALLAAEAGVEAASRLLGQVESRLEQGMAIEADRLRVQSELASLEAARHQANAAHEIAKESLRAFLGVPSGTELELSDPIEAVDQALSLIDMGLEDSGIEGRADLEAARATLEAADARTDGVRGQRLPVVEAFAGVSAHSWSSNLGASWTGGIRLSVPVFTGGAVSRQVESASARTRAGRIELTQRVRDAESEVLRARIQRDAAIAAHRSVQLSEAAAREAARLISARYGVGMTTLAELLQAEAALVNARRATAGRMAEVAMSRAELLFVVGKSTEAPNQDSSRKDR